MKTQNNNSVKLVMTLMILVGFCSCNKQEFNSFNNASVTVNNIEKGGDDDEEAIIQGIVQDSENTIMQATVELFQSEGEDESNSDAITGGNGQFTMTAETGTYFFVITEVDGSTSITDDFNLKANTSLTITID